MCAAVLAIMLLVALAEGAVSALCPEAYLKKSRDTGTAALNKAARRRARAAGGADMFVAPVSEESTKPTSATDSFGGGHDSVASGVKLALFGYRFVRQLEQRFPQKSPWLSSSRHSLSCPNNASCISRPRLARLA